jgi:hypothetical protein
MARTVIQIAADPSYLDALCDDGVIFRLVNHVWQAMAPIPQGDIGPRPKPGFVPFDDEPVRSPTMAKITRSRAKIANALIRNILFAGNTESG